MGFFKDIFDPGHKERGQAAALAKDAIIKGGNVTGPGGVTAGFDFSNGRGTANMGLGSFAEFLPMLQQNALQYMQQGTAGLPAELEALGAGTIDRLGQIDVNRLQNQSDFAKLGELFNARSDFAQRDVFDVGNEFSSRLRALSERRNNRLVSKTFDRLKRSGQLGMTAGAGAAAELDANLFDEGLKFDMAGLDFGSRELSRAFGEALGASGMREQIGARQYGEEMGLEQLGGQRALQQFGVGSTMFDQFLKSQHQGAALGQAAMSSAMGVSQLPLAFMQALQSSTALQSGSMAGAGNQMTQLASMTKSPFLEALNAAGTFMNSIKPDGI